MFVLCWVTQPCLTLCKPVDCSPPGSSVYGDSPGKNTGVGCHALLQGIFPTQVSNPGLPHCRQILYQLSYREAHVVKQMQPNVTVEVRLQECGIIVHSFKRTSWRWRTERPKKRTCHILPQECHTRMWCSELWHHLGIMSEKQENHRDANPEIWHYWVTMRDGTTSSPNS